MKANPLFSDSTKLKGDRITTELELRDIVLYEGEDVFLLIKNHLGIEREIPLEWSEDNIYRAMIWLNLQEEIEYCFVVKNADEVRLRSPMRKTRASYAINESWKSY